MKVPRPYLLSVAGFDPSAGAGVLADIKTMEQNKTYGLGVISANTMQHESEFSRVDWMPFEIMKGQIELLFKKYKIDVAKIGLIENEKVLLQLIDLLRDKNPKIKIIWDPVLHASAGFEFHHDWNSPLLEEMLAKITLITPNEEEAKKLGKGTVAENVAACSLNTSVLLKSAERNGIPGYDLLYANGGMNYSFKPKSAIYPKHGSGCVLSSAIASFLARGFTLRESCLRGKQYAARVFNSNKLLLSYHHL